MLCQLSAGPLFLAWLGPLPSTQPSEQLCRSGQDNYACELRHISASLQQQIGPVRQFLQESRTQSNSGLANRWLHIGFLALGKNTTRVSQRMGGRHDDSDLKWLQVR